jgi:hypothetical protein
MYCYYYVLSFFGEIFIYVAKQFYNLFVYTSGDDMINKKRDMKRLWKK